MLGLSTVPSPASWVSPDDTEDLVTRPTSSDSLELDTALPNGQPTVAEGTSISPQWGGLLFAMTRAARPRRLLQVWTRLTPQAPAPTFGDTDTKLEPGAGSKALLFNITSKSQKIEKKGCQDGGLHSPLAPPFIGRPKRGAATSTGSHRPPPLIQDDRALTLTLSRATRLRLHAAYVAKG